LRSGELKDRALNVRVESSLVSGRPTRGICMSCGTLCVESIRGSEFGGSWWPDFKLDLFFVGVTDAVRPEYARSSGRSFVSRADEDEKISFAVWGAICEELLLLPLEVIRGAGEERRVVIIVGVEGEDRVVADGIAVSARLWMPLGEFGRDVLVVDALGAAPSY